MNRAESTPTARKAGRPRDPETEKRILDVVLRLLAQQGYSRMSVEEIAREAGASKPTIYRRWPSKADLATAAVRTIRLAEPPVNTGTTTGDLAGILSNFRKSLLRPNGMALIGAVLVEEKCTPELLRLFRERIVLPRRRMLGEVLKRAAGRRELRPNVNLAAAVNLLVGAFYAHYLANPKIPAHYPRELVGIVWEGLRRR